MVEYERGLPGLDLKEWRAVATRYKKTTSSFVGDPYLAATLDHRKR
jgi:hypothetical protein